MTTHQTRQPALQRRVDPVAAAIPDRVGAAETAAKTPPPVGGTAAREPLNTSLQVRIRAHTRERLDEAVRKLQYERRDRSVSLSSLTDEVLDTWLAHNGF
ncbi:hypothetical protein [Mycobacterium avium]|uniref:hypothetical protein n=1 Tax=Mycobacterium avium TaxID=1764 RepID=UPI001155D0F8|nr:hypothetical protein [Mycobacterium avium]